MLQAIRSTVGSWVVKILFVLLILSFGVWGIGDMFRGGGASNTVAEVGPVEVGRGELDQEFRRQMERLRPLFGGALTADQARQFGLVDQSLNSIVQRTLFDLAARDAGVAVNDAVVRHRIGEEPAFRNAQGKFDPNQFQTVLRNNNLTESMYVASLRHEIARTLVAGAVAAGAKPPQPLVEALYRQRGERRVAELVTIPNAAVGDVGEPNPEQVKSFHDDHGVRFTAPEYRGLTVARLSVDDVAKDMTLTDEQLRAYYDEHIANYQTPERRTVKMVLVDDEAKARTIAEAAKTAGLDEAAKQSGTDVVPLEDVVRNELPDADLSAAAFSQPEGVVGAPVKSALGWHVLQITKVQPGTSRSFEQVRDEVLARARRDKGFDLIYEVSNRIDDQLAAGTALEELAAKQGMALTKVAAVDATGKAPDGTAPTLSDLPKIVQTAYGLNSGQTSGLTEGANSAFFVVRVDGITAPALRPLEEVRAQVVDAWKAEEREKRAAERARKVAEALKAGSAAGAQQAAQEAGGSFSMTAPFTRDARSVEGLTPELIRKLFDAKPEEVVTGAGADSQIVARLKEIIPADPKAPDAPLAAVEENVARGIESDLIAQFTQALQAEYPVTINRESIAQMYAPTN